MYGTSAAACVPASQQQHQSQHMGWEQQGMDVDMGPQHQDSVGNLAATEPNSAYPLISALPQGTCFSQPSNASSSLTDSTGGSSSSCGNSNGSSQQVPQPPAYSPDTAALLCHSPSVSTDSSPAQPAFPAGQQHEPACKRHCQHAMLQDMQSGGSGMDSHQLAVSCRPSHSQQSLQPLLDAAASIPKPSAGAAAGAAAAGRFTSMSLLAGRTPHPAQQQPAAAAASVHSPGYAAKPSHPAAAATEDYMCTSPYFSHSPAPHLMAAGAAAATAGAAHGSSGSSSLEFAQTFLAASASPAAVAAFAVLAHNKLLPVLALETESGQELPGPAGPHTSLEATLAYMFILASRGDVEEFSDTTIRTLLWMTESFFSQYRGACKVAAYDYCFYASGLEAEDPYVTDTLAEEIPAMVQLQRDILVNSDFRLLVTEQQLQYACSTLASASNSSIGFSSSSSSSSSGLCSLAAIQQLVDQQVQEYQGWFDGAADAIHRQQKRKQQQQQPKPKQQQPVVQLFPGEVVIGYLVSETAEAGAAEAGAAEAGAAAEARRMQPGTHVSGAHQQGQRQQRPALQDISNSNLQQLQDAQGPPHGLPAAVGDAPHRSQKQQQQQRRVQTRQQWRQAQQQHVPGKENAGAGAGKSDSKRAKDQLLQLASKEQAVGSKRRRSTTAAAEGAAAGEQVQERSGVVAGFGAGGRRVLSTVMRTARSAAQYLGCGYQ